MAVLMPRVAVKRGVDTDAAAVIIVAGVADFVEPTKERPNLPEECRSQGETMHTRGMAEDERLVRVDDDSVMLASDMRPLLLSLSFSLSLSVLERSIN